MNAKTLGNDRTGTVLDAFETLAGVGPGRASGWTPRTTCRWLGSAVLAALPLTAPLADCTPTPHRTTGTHYEPVTEHKIDVSSGVVVRGRVLAAPDCRPVANARIAHWQAGEKGHYTDRLRAYLFSDSSGHYQFGTEWPNLPVPHIHFIVTADGYEVLETQWIGSGRARSIEFDMVLRKK